MPEEVYSDTSIAAAMATAKLAQDLAVKTDLTTSNLTISITKLSESNVRLEEGFKYIQKDLSEIKTNLSNKYVSHETYDPFARSVKETAEDHENRMRFIEFRVYIAIGIVAVLTFAFEYFKK